MTEHIPQICFVLLPGLAPDNVPVLRLSKVLEGRGYAVVASNFFGDMPVDDFSNLTTRQCSDAISDIIQTAKTKHEKVIGIGLSLGGALLLEHAKKHNNLDGIISIGTPLKLKSRPLISVGLAVIPFIYPLWRRLQRYKRLRLLPIGAANMVIGYIEKEFAQNLESITTPTLLLHSKNDWVSDYNAMPALMDDLSSKIKELIILNNGGHVIESDADLIVHHAEALLKKIDGDFY